MRFSCCRDAAVIGARGLTFRYPAADEPILRRLDIDVRAGEMVAMLGPSGCGKSTLLYLLGLFLHPSDGRLALADIDTTRLGDRERSLLRAHWLGFVLQDAALHAGMSLLSNVLDGALYGGWTRSAARMRARELLERYGLLEVADQLPSQVSGGQAQRAALCRALIREPRIVLADEPTGNLDDVNAEAVIAGLRGAADGGAAVVVVTHSRQVAAAADRILELQ